MLYVFEGASSDTSVRTERQHSSVALSARAKLDRSGLLTMMVNYHDQKCDRQQEEFAQDE